MPGAENKKDPNRTAWTLCSLACISVLVILWSDMAGLASRVGTLLAPKPAIGGSFSLTGTNGKTITQDTLVGSPTALFFGYTFCPDVCPTTLYEASNWLKQLGPDGDRIKIYFVSVDPQRDSRDHLTEYMSAFDDRIVGLTGSQQAIDQIVQAYRVYVEKNPAVDQDSPQTEGDTSDEYLINHTASVYLLGKDGQFVDTIAYQQDQAKALEKLRYLIKIQ